jgi:O-antigen ligase
MVLMALCVFVLPKPWQDRLLNSAHIWVTYDAPGKPHAANETRILIWAAGWEMIKDHPLGVGQGNLSTLFVNYLSPESPMVRSEPDVPHLHDNFLQVTAQNGWQGLVAYLAWIACFGVAAWRFSSKDGQAEDLNRAFTAVFLGVLVWGLTEYTFSHQFMNFQFFTLGLQMALWRVSPRSGSAKGSKGQRTRPAR